MEECFDSMTADQLRHVCETQRVEIRRLRLLTGEAPRGEGGFGSTDKTLGTANASDRAEPESRRR